MLVGRLTSIRGTVTSYLSPLRYKGKVLPNQCHTVPMDLPQSLYQTLLQGLCAENSACIACSLSIVAEGFCCALFQGGVGCKPPSSDAVNC